MTGRTFGVKMGENKEGGSLISPDGVASSRIVGVFTSDISPCIIKSRRRFLPAPAYLCSPGKRAVKWLYVCVTYFTVSMYDFIQLTENCLE